MSATRLGVEGTASSALVDLSTISLRLAFDLPRFALASEREAH